MGPGRPPEAPQRPHGGLAWSRALLRAPAGSCSKPLFVVGLGFALVCVFGFVVIVVVVVVVVGCCCWLLLLSFVRVVCLYVCFFGFCVLFSVVVFLFYAFAFAMFEDYLKNSRVTSKRHATCSNMSPSGLVGMLIRVECVGSAPVVMVPL